MCWARAHRRLDRFMQDERVKTGLFGLWFTAKAGSAAMVLATAFIIDAAVTWLDEE